MVRTLLPQAYLSNRVTCPRCQLAYAPRRVVVAMPGAGILSQCLCRELRNDASLLTIRDSRGVVSLLARHGFTHATRGVIEIVAAVFADPRDISPALQMLSNEALRRGAWRLQASVAGSDEVAHDALTRNGFAVEGRKREAYRLGDEYQPMTLLGHLLVEPAPSAPFEAGESAPAGDVGTVKIVRAQPEHAAAYMEFDVAVRRETPNLMREASEMPPSAASYAEMLRELTGEDRIVLLASNPAGRVAGAIGGLTPFGPCADGDVALWIAVRQAYWSQGVAKGLLDALKGWARAGGRHRLTAEVLSVNERALEFFARHGFQQEAVRRAAAVWNGSYLDESVLGCIL